MSSLEDVFLTIAKKAEADEAKTHNQTTMVTLTTGEQVSPTHHAVLVSQSVSKLVS